MTETELIWIRFHFGAECPQDIRDAVMCGGITVRECVRVAAEAWLTKAAWDGEEPGSLVVESMARILSNLDEAAKYAAGAMGLA